MRSFVTIARPLFRRGQKLRLAGGGDLAAIHAELARLIGLFDEEARREGHSDAAVEHCRYALCAWLDEMLFSSRSISIEWLGHSLAVRLFQDPAAGNGFFERMRQLHRRVELGDALAFYAHCILLGFRGRYQIEDPTALRTVVAEALGKHPDARWKDALFFPARDIPPGSMKKERTGRLLLWISVALLGVSGSVYALLVLLARRGL